jgi:hypothetical protein
MALKEEYEEFTPRDLRGSPESSCNEGQILKAFDPEVEVPYLWEVVYRESERSWLDQLAHVFVSIESECSHES